MGQQIRVRPRAQLVLGLVCIAFGALPVLSATGLVPPPQSSSAPPWIGALAGLVFVVGGACFLIRALRGPSGGPARNDPPGVGAAQYLAVIGVFAGFAAVNTWVAFGPGARAFSTLVGGAARLDGAEVLGRAAFGFGAVVAWLCVAVILLSSLKLRTGERRA